MAASSILGPSPYSFPIILPPSSLVPDNYRLTRSFSPEMPRSFHGKQNSTEIEYNSFPLDGTGWVGGIHLRAKWSLLGYFSARYSATFGQKLKSSFSTVLLSKATGNLLEITWQLLQSPPCRPGGERRVARGHGGGWQVCLHRSGYAIVCCRLDSSSNTGNRREPKFWELE